MEVAVGSAHSCHRAPSNDATTDAAQVKELDLKCDGFRNDGEGLRSGSGRGQHMSARRC